MSHPRAARILALLALVSGIWLRFASLADRPFATDEAIQYYATRGLVETGRPVLPSGVLYQRGIGYSRLAAPLLARSTTPETAMRIPAAVLGSLALAGFTAIGWALGGPWTAFWCALLMGLYPEALRLSRFGRFYTLQLAFGIIALYAGWRSFAPPRRAEDAAWSRQWAWIVLTVVAFMAASAVQLTTLSVTLAWVALMAGQGVIDWRRHGASAWRWSAALQFTTLLATFGVALVLLRSSDLARLLDRALAVPLWARLGATGNEPMTFYYRALSASWPIGISLLPVAALWLYLRRARLAIYLLGWFGIALLVHSLLLPWKQERYVLVAVPAWLLLLALAATAAAGTVYRFLATTLADKVRKPGPAAGALVALAALAVVITQPAFNRARRMPAAGDEDGWHATAAILRREPGLGGFPLAATSPLPALHYWGRLDFTVQPALRERWSDSGYVVAPTGASDIYAGVPVLPGPSDIRSAYRDQPGVVIGIDRKYVDSHNIDPSLVDTLERAGTELCRGRCGTMRLYRWRF